MHADLEAVRVAELYASHPLLRNLPIPRFRLPDVRIDVPVVIKQVDQPPSGEPARGAPTVESMRRAFDKVLTKRLGEENIRLTPKHTKRLKSELDQKESSLTKPAEVAVDVIRVADELAETASSTLTGSGGPVPPKRRSRLEEKLKQAARIAFLKLRGPLARLHALVTTSEISEAGPSDVVTRLQLKITEEGVEQTTIESDGRKEDRLVPE